MFLAHGANVSTPDFEGWTASHFASERGKCPIVISLIEAGAEIDTFTSHGGAALHPSI